MVFVILPVTGAIIGWITNVLAVYMLFRPLDPWKLNPFPFSLQGLIPKRRERIAESVGQVVAQQLFSVDELAGRFNTPALRADVQATVKGAVENWCDRKMSMLPGSIRQYCSSYLRDAVAEEVAREFPKLAASMIVRLREQVDVEMIVREKINMLPLQDVEALVLTVAKRELKQIERLGAILGFIIGFLQALVVYWLV